MEIHFDNLENVVKEELCKAKDSIKIAVAWLDFQTFEATFRSVLNMKVSLDIVIDDNTWNRKFQTIITQLENIGATIKFQQMLPSNYSHMHHKFCIIDLETVINGSYNWTYTANTFSFENLTIIRKNQIAIDRFSDEFDILKTMTPSRLQSIQHLKDCNKPGCIGKLVNLLIYGPHVHKYGEMVGDIVEACTEDPYDHFSKIELSVIDNTISGFADDIFYSYQEMLDEFELHDEELTTEKNEEIKNRLNYKSDRKYIVYSNNNMINSSSKNIVIHGWGLIKSHPLYDKHEDPDYYTEIVWKDRFVKSQIDDTYETTFDIY